MAESNRQIIRKKRAQEDPALREILDRKLTAAEIEGIEIVKSAPTEEVKRATQVIQQGFLDHPDAEIRRGAAEILKAAEIPKNSPLIDQIASRVRPGTPPATQPLTAIGARNVGHQDTAPGQAVPGVDRVVVHRHEGLPEGRTAYWHGHDHDDTVNSNQGEAGIVNYDNRRHLNDPRHTRARGVGLFGVWEAKSAGSSVTDATKAISADSLRVQKLGDDLHDLHVDRLVRDRIESNTAAIQTLSMIAELAELRKGSRETTNKAAAIDPRVRRLVDEQQELRAIHANTGGVTTKTAQRRGVSVADLQRAAAARMRKNARTIRAIAGGDVDWDGRLIQKVARVDVTKAVQSSTSQLMAEQIGRTVREAVDRAMASFKVDRKR